MVMSFKNLAIVNTEKTFYASNHKMEIGMGTEDQTIINSLARKNGSKKVIYAGTVYPSNDASAVGLVVNDTIVEDKDGTYSFVGSLCVHGLISERKLPATVSTAAKTAMKLVHFISADAENQPSLLSFEPEEDVAAADAIGLEIVRHIRLSGANFKRAEVTDANLKNYIDVVCTNCTATITDAFFLDYDLVVTIQIATASSGGTLGVNIKEEINSNGSLLPDTINLINII